MFLTSYRATIPPRIMSQRTIAASSTFSSFLAMGIYTYGTHQLGDSMSSLSYRHVFYLPFYFQAVKGTSAEGSGIRSIPYLVSTTLASGVISGAITAFGWYTPFMWLGAAIFTLGAGMLYTLRVSDYSGFWIGWQLLAGIGAGCGLQIPFIAVQVVLNAKDMPTGNAISIFFNSLGGAISISIAQNIFSNTLVKQLPLLAPDVNPAIIIAAGASHVREVTPIDQLDGVLQAYNMAVTRAFILPIAAGGLAFIASLFVSSPEVAIR